MQYLPACPVCKQTNFSHYLTCKDHTVSNETFQLEKCPSCGLVMTNPRPPDELLSKYYQSDAYISHSNKSTNLIDKVYKVLRTFTLRWKYDLIQKHSISTPSTLLDFGCGTGTFLQECQKRGMNVTGMEPDSNARAQAKKNTNLDIHSDLNQINREFEVITLWHVLEHVSDLNGTLDKLRSVLRENGTMFIAVPNLQSSDASKYGEHWAAYDVPRHLWHFSRSTMGALLQRHRLKVEGVLPMRLDAYYVSLLSEKYRKGEQDISSMSRAVIQGFKSNWKAKRTQEYSSLIYIVRK